MYILIYKSHLTISRRTSRTMKKKKLIVRKIWYVLVADSYKIYEHFCQQPLKFRKHQISWQTDIATWTEFLSQSIQQSARKNMKTDFPLWILSPCDSGVSIWDAWFFSLLLCFSSSQMACRPGFLPIWSGHSRESQQRVSSKFRHASLLSHQGVLNLWQRLFQFLWLPNQSDSKLNP